MAKKDFIVHIDLNNQQLLNATLQNLATFPSTTGRTEGFMFWHTGDDTAYVYTGLASPNEWLDLGEVYTHPDFSATLVNEASATLNSASVVSKITVNSEGHVTEVRTRTITPGDIGAALEVHKHTYSDVINLPANTILANNTIGTSSAKAITADQMLTMLSIAYGSYTILNTGTDTANRTWKASDLTQYIAERIAALTTASNLSLGTRTGTTMPITNDNGTGVTLPEATTTYAGLLKATDKTKLDGIEAGANLYEHPTHSTANDFSTPFTSGLNVLGEMQVAANGHVTKIGKRTITAADLAAVIFNNATNSGTTTTWTSTKIFNEINNAIDQAKTGGLQYKGEYNASTNIPGVKLDTTIKIGYTYVVSAAGQFIGTTEAGYLEKGDMLIAKTDNPGSTLANWQIVNKNIPEILSATTAIEGIVYLATEAEAIAGTNDAKAITPLTLHAALDASVGGYATNFGDGATTSFTITHGLNTQDVVIQIQKVSNRSEVIMATGAPSTTTVSISCNIAPTSGEYRVIIKK